MKDVPHHIWASLRTEVVFGMKEMWQKYAQAGYRPIAGDLSYPKLKPLNPNVQL